MSMDVEELIPHCYSELIEIDYEMDRCRFNEAVSRSDSLIKLLEESRPTVSAHVNYPLFKGEIDRIEAEAQESCRRATIRDYLSYGARLIRTNPFVAIIHLGNDLKTKGFPDLEALRARLHEAACESWFGDESKSREHPKDPYFAEI